ncbi:hypothetical protein [Candidatus Stoquefichus massiliensis]|uniref:hypothetical protein n=1 Tax=Candidatus Stoquefichus massiliensis TaxID=1470350 RepID=UPI0004B3C1D2|nr:hypothetical protein [Candidatus Stoquefichus massiliensis]
MAKMKVQSFINKAIEVEKLPTLYKLGKFMNSKSGKYLLCDCSGLIKGILWGYPSAGKYASNNVPDINADTMISRCSNVTTNFTKLQPGWLVWMKGHIGIYVGDGVVIESSPIWENGIQKTYCKGCGLSNRSHLHERKWSKCGRLDCYIDYSSESESAPSKPKDTKVNAFYRVRTQKHGWLSEVKNLEDYAGYQDSPITDVAIRVDKGKIKYRVHVKGGKWLGWITECDIKNSYKYAGNGKAIDLVQVYYYTPDDIRPYKKAKYKTNYGWQYDTETNNNQDGYAGVLGKNATKLYIEIV